MDKAPDQYGEFWQYLSQNQRDLILEGNYLMDNVLKTTNYAFKDYSFVIFPYAKAYEGFLKQLFLDVKFINHLDYISTHLRLGKLLSPNLVTKLGDRSLYLRIAQASSEDTAKQIWDTWKLGRNEIFHYFPHNLKSVTFEEAQTMITTIIETMELAYRELYAKAKS